METLDRALAWQTAEPIRVQRPGSPEHGGILHGFDQRRGGPLGLYTEITGYAVSLFTFLLGLGGYEKLRMATMEASDYLLRIQDRSGAFPHLPDPRAVDGPWSAYSFDVAACIVGLARCGKLLQGRRYLDSAASAARWLLGLQRPDGSFFAMMDKGGGLRDPGGFYGDGSCIHAKNAIALLELHAATGREEYRRAAERVCDYTLALQSTDGAFRSRPGSPDVFTHAHAYACEGLLYSGVILGEDRFKAAARKGVAWLANHQQDDGGWLSHYNSRPLTRRRVVDAILRPRPSDAAAQSARLFSLMSVMGEGGVAGEGGNDHEGARRAAIGFLLRCQEAGGGFHYRRTRFGLSPFLDTWSAQFAVQAFVWDTRPALVGELF